MSADYLAKKFRLMLGKGSVEYLPRRSTRHGSD